MFYIGVKILKKWIVFFESGGFCFLFVDCNRCYLSKNLMILMILNKLFDRIIGWDLFFVFGSENLVFFWYNYVFVLYCSSDFWFGLKINFNKLFCFVNDLFVDNFSFRG